MLSWLADAMFACSDIYHGIIEIDASILVEIDSSILVTIVQKASLKTILLKYNSMMNNVKSV